MKPQPLRKLLSPSRPLTYGIVQAGPHIPDGVPYIRPVDMTATLGVANEDLLQRTSREIASAYERASLREGDVVLSIGPSFGKVMLVPPSLAGANLTQGTARLAPGPGVDGRWLYWVLQSRPITSFWESVVAGGTFRALNLGPLGETPVPLVNHDRQRRIADFLDDRVSRIDRIIAARGEQAELALRAQGAALTEATTPPADPTGWVRLKFSRVAVLNDGLVDPTVEPHASMALIAPNHIEKGTGRLISLESAEAQGATSGKGLVRKGQIIYSKIRPSLRKAVVAPDDCLCSADAYAIEPRDEVVSRDYLLACLLGDYFTQQVIDASERVAMPKVNRDSLAEVFIWVPPRDVQERRVVALHNQARHMGLGLDLMTDSCARLIEYKSSLITAAVVGELDVSTAGSSIPG